MVQITVYSSTSNGTAASYEEHSKLSVSFVHSFASSVDSSGSLVLKSLSVALEIRIGQTQITNSDIRQPCLATFSIHPPRNSSEHTS